MPPYTPTMLRVGEMAGRVALFNWSVFALAILVSFAGPFSPSLRAFLLSAGGAGIAFGWMVVASSISVYIVALILVQRDPHLSAKGWSRWSIALLVCNIIAGNLYVALWWLRRRRRSTAPGPLQRRVDRRWARSRSALVVLCISSASGCQPVSSDSGLPIVPTPNSAGVVNKAEQVLREQGGLAGSGRVEQFVSADSGFSVVVTPAIPQRGGGGVVHVYPDLPAVVTQRFQ